MLSVGERKQLVLRLIYDEYTTQLGPTRRFFVGEKSSNESTVTQRTAHLAHWPTQNVSADRRLRPKPLHTPDRPITWAISIIFVHLYPSLSHLVTLTILPATPPNRKKRPLFFFLAIAGFHFAFHAHHIVPCPQWLRCSFAQGQAGRQDTA
jgi:hypothetical protein